jgi:serine/threonine-protein kinase
VPDHDTDPLADTATSGSESGTKRRGVHAGDTLGRYELVEEVGEGGMATVFRARDKELRRDVAVKVLFPHLTRRSEVVRRFQREARAAATLEHANILRIYDVGGDGDDPPYIVMELIRGRSLLGELEQRGAMLAEVVACLGAVLADALGAAHKAGIIHRDVKPANVMIAGDGRVLLADFGVARLETEDSLVTKTGALLGTPAYMPPEQAVGDTATAKSDLYALGATLYQLATGALPYGGSPAKVLAAIAQGALVPAVKRRSAVGPDLSAAIGRMMASDPEARPASAAEVASELRSIAAAAGLGDASDELAAYFQDPEAFVRGRIPTIVAAVVADAKTALADKRLPRALALADRATALAPDDPAVKTLVERVTEGDAASRRRRRIAVVAIAACAATGTVVGVQKLRSSHPAVLPASAAAIDARTIDAPVDAVLADTPLSIDAPLPVDAVLLDASRARPRGDASIVVVPAVVSIDAAEIAAAPPPPDTAAPPAPGRLAVTNDTWCELTIDGAPHGRLPQSAFPIAAGPHSVTCSQPSTGLRWTHDVEVRPGELATIGDHMLRQLDVTFAIDASLDGTAHRRGDVVRVQQGGHELEAHGVHTFPSFRVACTVRDQPTLDCY